MISNKHPNKVHRHAAKDAAIPKRTASIKTELHMLDDTDIYKQDGVKMTPTKGNAAKAALVTPEKDSPQRGRTYACSSADEISKAFGIDINKEKMAERSLPRARTYAISGMGEFRTAFNQGQ